MERSVVFGDTPVQSRERTRSLKLEDAPPLNVALMSGLIFPSSRGTLFRTSNFTSVANAASTMTSISTDYGSCPPNHGPWLILKSPWSERRILRPKRFLAHPQIPRGWDPTERARLHNFWQAKIPTRSFRMHQQDAAIYSASISRKDPGWVAKIICGCVCGWLVSGHWRLQSITM